MRKQSRLPLALLAAVILSALAVSPAMALCYAECPSGDSCTGRPICCCVDDTWAYCGPSAGNPCGWSAASATDEDAAVQSSYAAIFSAAAPESEVSQGEPAVSSTSR